MCNHAGVFMVRGVTKNWKQPIGFFLTHGTMAPLVLVEKIKECIGKLQNIGLKPIVFVSDQGSNNRSAINSLGVTIENPHFTVNGQKIHVLFDAPHLLKNIRNNLKKHNFSDNQYYYRWSHVEQLFKEDSSKPIRLVPKLTFKHINLPAFSTMSVPLAVQV